MAVLRRRVRSRPIRLFLIGMLAVPLISVVGLWVFATVITVRSAISNHNYNSDSRAITSKGELLSVGLTEERAQTYLWLAADKKTAKNSVLATRTLVNQAIPGAETSLNAGGTPLTSMAASGLKTWFAELGQLPKIRAAIDSGAMSPLDAFGAYTAIIDGQFRYYYASIQDTSAALAEPAIGVSNVAYALEMANRETVLAGGAFADQGMMSAATGQTFADAAANRQLLMNTAITLLPPTMSPAYVNFANSPQSRQFQALENQITASLGSGKPIPVSPKAWQSASQGYLNSLLGTELSSATHLAGMSASASDRS